MKYFNMKNSYGVETIDELDQKDFKTFKDFKIELRRLLNEYTISGHSGVYVSNRCTKDWREK